MTEPVIYDRVPVVVDLEAGETYWFCQCGRSETQPFCDGRHKGSGLGPLKWTADTTRKAAFCLCKHTGNAPFCDGSHRRV